MTPTANDTTQKMLTLSEGVTHAWDQGYRENFAVDSIGLKTANGKFVYSPSEVIIDNFYRFEGYSDPADNSILFLIQTSDWKKGVLVDAYDTNADTRLSNFIKRVEEMHKRPPHKKTTLLDPLLNIFKTK